MKLILAILHNDDSPSVTSALTREGYYVTCLLTTGGFLLVGNSTSLIGTEDTRVERAIAIPEKFCTTNTEVKKQDVAYGSGLNPYSLPETVSVGEATVIILYVAGMGKM